MQFIRSDQKGRVRGVKGLVGFGQTRNGSAEFALFEGVQAQARFVEQKNGVLEVVRALGKKDDEERNQPLNTFGALVQLDLDSIVVHQVSFDAGGEMIEMDQRPDSEKIAEPYEKREALLQRPKRGGAALVRLDRLDQIVVTFFFRRVALFDIWKSFFEREFEHPG